MREYHELHSMRKCLIELYRHFVLPRFLWTAQGKDGLKWVGLNSFEFLSQIFKFSLKYETFCLQN